MQVLSKFVPKIESIDVPCTDFHSWNQSCVKTSLGMGICSIQESMKIYSTVYFVSLLMKRRIPTLLDLKRTLISLLRSSCFLTMTATGFPFFVCLLRKLLGSINVYSGGFLPAFLASVVAIFIERPSRRPLLALYCANVGTESVWKMAEARGCVKSSTNKLVLLFGVSTALLTYYYKKGYHLNLQRADSLFKGLQFIVGDIRKENEPVPDPQRIQKPEKITVGKTLTHYGLIASLVRCYINFVKKLKELPVKSKCCPHKHSCVHYCLSGSVKLFGTGVAIQLVLKLALKLKRIIKNPNILLRKDTFQTGLFLGGFAAIFRSVSCLLRATTKRDHAFQVFPSVLAASTTLHFNPDATVVLYIFWKCLQITFQIGESFGYWRSIPKFYEFLHCFWTAVIFHAAIVEPRHIRLSYWKFLMKVSGGRVAAIDRKPIDLFGVESSKQLQEILRQTNGKIKTDFFW